MKTKQKMQLRPVGVIRTPFKECAGAPIQPPMSDGAEGIVEVFAEFAPALKDLAGFDRIWLLYWFHRTRGPQLRVTPFMDTGKR